MANMATTILQGILKPTQELDGVRYFDGEGTILLAAAVSDFGRDYMIDTPANSNYDREVKLGIAIEEIYAGRWIPGPEIEARLQKLTVNFPQFALQVIEGFGGFYYRDPRHGEEDVVLDPLSDRTDLPEKFIGRLGGAHYSTIRKIYRKLVVNPSFLGEVKGRLNGLELSYFETQYIQPQGGSYYDQGFYLHYFFGPESELVAWKTGIPSNFIREGHYTIVGGSVKAHDSYPGQPPKTLISRAKFFDHQTGDKYLEQ